MTLLAHSLTTNKLVHEAANGSAWVSEKYRKIPPALGTNQVARFGGFHPLTSLEKKINVIMIIMVNYIPRFNFVYKLKSFF